MYDFMYKESRSALNICGTLLSLFIFLRTKGSSIIATGNVKLYGADPFFV